MAKGQGDLGVFQYHGQKGADQHPEHRPRAPQGESRGHPHDGPDPQSSRQSHGQCAKGGDPALPLAPEEQTDTADGVEQVKAPQGKGIVQAYAEEQNWRGGQKQSHGHHLGGVYAS